MSNRQRCRMTLAGALIGGLLGGVAVAETVRVRDVAFERELPVAGAVLRLQGAGLLKYLGMVPVYAAAFYLAPGAEATDPLADVVKCLDVEYLVSVEARRFNEAGAKHLAETLPPETLDALRARIDTISAWYPDPKVGDRCTLTYRPGHGTELSYNGRVLGVVPGEDFQRAYFSIWLGTPSASDALRKALLGGD